MGLMFCVITYCGFDLVVVNSTLDFVGFCGMFCC